MEWREQIPRATDSKDDATKVSRDEVAKTVDIPPREHGRIPELSKLEIHLGFFFGKQLVSTLRRMPKKKASLYSQKLVCA